MRQFLPLLLLLACPLMMIFMMRGGHDSGHASPRTRGTREQRIADLEREITALGNEPDDDSAPLDAGRR